jgi:hypothetical protein
MKVRLDSLDEVIAELSLGCFTSVQVRGRPCRDTRTTETTTQTADSVETILQRETNLLCSRDGTAHVESSQATVTTWLWMFPEGLRTSTTDRYAHMGKTAHASIQLSLENSPSDVWHPHISTTASAVKRSTMHKHNS